MSSEEQKGDDMSPKEREEWLRSHGVQIEDFKKKQDSGVTAPIWKVLEGDDDVEGMEMALIPHDSSLPIRSVRIPASVADAVPGDAIPDFVKPYFGTSKGGKSPAIDAALLKDQAKKQLAGGDLDSLDPSKVSADAMNSVAAHGSVETFPLVHPADTNHYTGVYVYLDEVGLLRRLPINVRAGAMAEACGYSPAPTFYGDVFVGRVRTRPAMTNVDFVVGTDTDRGSEWMLRAVSENLAWQQEMKRVTGEEEGKSQPAVAGADGRAEKESEGFSWTQDEDEIELVIDFDVDVNKRLVKVVFLPSSIRVTYDGEIVASVKLFAKIDVDGCTWTLGGKDQLVLTLEKAEAGAMWPRIKV